MKFSANQITALSLITGAILITLFNSLIPVNAANPFSLSFDPSVSSDVVDDQSSTQHELPLWGSSPP